MKVTIPASHEGFWRLTADRAVWGVASSSNSSNYPAHRGRPGGARALTPKPRLGVGIGETAVDDELASGRFHVSLPVSSRSLNRSLILCKVDQMSDQCEPGSEMVRYVPDVKSVETGEFDYKKYERIVRNVANRGPREFKEMQERELLAERMRNLVRARVRVSVEEARMQFERERSKATVRTVHANRDWFARYLVSLSPAEITRGPRRTRRRSTRGTAKIEFYRRVSADQRNPVAAVPRRARARIIRTARPARTGRETPACGHGVRDAGAHFEPGP